MTRILPTRENIRSLFDETTVPYPVPSGEGGYIHVDMPAWKCKGCGWTSLYGVHNLAFAHECPTPPASFSGVATASEKFGS